MMGMPSKIYASQLVQIQSEKMLAATSELNLASSLVTGCYEANGIGYRAATQVNGLSPEICIVPEADVVYSTKGRTLIAVAEQGDESPSGSDLVALYQRAIIGTRESPILQTTLWGLDLLLVPMKQGNACGGKGLAGELLEHGHIFYIYKQVREGNESELMTCTENDRGVLLKSRMRENHKYCSVMGLTASSGQNNTKRRGI
jgi:hypothetical protein